MTITSIQFDHPDTCPACGASPVSVKVEDPVSDDSSASCDHCGHGLGRFGDYKAKFLEDAKGPALTAARKEAEELLKQLKMGK